MNNHLTEILKKIEEIHKCSTLKNILVGCYNYIVDKNPHHSRIPVLEWFMKMGLENEEKIKCFCNSVITLSTLIDETSYVVINKLLDKG